MDYSPLDSLAEQAAQKMLQDGIEGISDKEFALVMAQWTNSRADARRKEVIDALEKHANSNGRSNGSKMNAVKRHGPGAGGGFGLGVLVSFLREFVGG